MFGIHQMLSHSQLLPIPTIPHSTLIIHHSHCRLTRPAFRAGSASFA
jgi:hypothetical protein